MSSGGAPSDGQLDELEMTAGPLVGHAGRQDLDDQIGPELSLLPDVASAEAGYHRAVRTRCNGPVAVPR